MYVYIYIYIYIHVCICIYIYIYIYISGAPKLIERPRDGPQNPAPNLSLWLKPQGCLSQSHGKRCFGRCSPRSRAIFQSLSCGRFLHGPELLHAPSGGFIESMFENVETLNKIKAWYRQTSRCLWVQTSENLRR